MTFSKLTWLKRTDGHKFTGAEFRVLIALFNHTSADGTNAHPGLKLLAEETGYRKSGVSEAITSLKARGWIRETRKGSGFTGNASVFALVPDGPNLPSSSAVPEQPPAASSSARPEQPRSSSSAPAEPVVPLYRNNPPEVVPLERKPSNPGLPDPGSDPFSSDQGEVRYPPNHLESEDEIGLRSRSLSIAGRTHPTATEDLSQYEPDQDMSPKAQRIRAHKPFWMD